MSRTVHAVTPAMVSRATSSFTTLSADLEAKLKARPYRQLMGAPALSA